MECLIPTDPTVVDKRPLMADAIDRAAAENGAATWAEYPVSTKDYSQGYRQVTYRDLSTAISKVTSYILKVYGQGHNFETLAYCGLNDLRYPVFIIAALKAGYKLLLPSPRNSADAHRNLFEKSYCRKLIAPSPLAASLQQVVDGLNIKVTSPPSLEEIFTSNSGNLDEKTESSRPFSCVESDPLVVLQTSGTTGHPKPIIIPQAFATIWSRMTAFEPKSGISQVNFLHSRRIFCTLPMFHAVGVYFGLISPIYRSTTFIQAPSQAIPTAESLCSALEINHFQTAFVAPSLVEELAKDSTLLTKASSALQTIVYTGGDLPQWAGDKIASTIHLFPIYGTTEVGHGPQITWEGRSPEDWGYLRWDEKLWGVKFEQHNDDLYELTFEKNDISARFQAGFTIFADQQSFRTKDLFSKHPSVPNLWKYRGRSDDTLVFVTGEKFNPVSYEGELSRNPEIQACLIIGEKRFQSALLIEAKQAKEETDTDLLLDRLWPSIETINHTLPNFAHILKSQVIFTKPDKPLVRAGKGTVIRRLSLELYADEIEELYTRSESSSALSSPPNGLSLCNFEDISAIQLYLQNLVLLVTGWDHLEVTEDLFTRGMTSLQALHLRSQLQNAGNIPINIIYQNPTLDLLAHAIQPLLKGSEEGDPTRISRSRQKPALDQLLQTYKTMLAQVKCIESGQMNTKDRENTKKNVILTGSTGTVGVHILRSLLSMEAVGHVYCLCRGKEGRDRQMRALARHKLSYAFSEHVSFLETNLAVEKLGLKADQYDRLVSEVDIIIHNAWKVDFMQSLQSFDDSINGVINLLALARTASSGCKFLFVSSISAVQRVSPKSDVPEEIIADASISSENGYGQSKWLAEQIIGYAASKYGMSTVIARLGQITGPSTLRGNWSSSEWFPSMVITSQHMGCLPSTMPFSDHQSKESWMPWIPVDIAAEILAKCALQERARLGSIKGDTGQVVHIANPHQSRWSESLSKLQAQLSQRSMQSGQREDNGVSILPYSNWLDALREISISQSKTEDIAEVVERYPALKLLDFFEEGAQSTPLPTLDMKKSIASLPGLGDVQAMNGEFLCEWARQWVKA